MCAAQKGVQSGIGSLVPASTLMGAFGAAGLALSVLSLGFGVAELCNTWKYGSICESRESDTLPASTNRSIFIMFELLIPVHVVDECLITTIRIMFSCETITRRLLIPQNEPPAGGHGAALQREKWWQNFTAEAIRITGEDPVTTAFTFRRHYSVYLAVQNSALKKARARLDTLAKEN